MVRGRDNRNHLYSNDDGVDYNNDVNNDHNDNGNNMMIKKMVLIA